MSSSATEHHTKVRIEPKPGSVEVTMPETDAEGNPALLIAWHVQPGETVAEDEPICTVQITGGMATVTSPASGRLRSLNVGVRAQVEPGTPLALVEPAEESAPEPAVEVVREPEPQSAAEPPPTAGPAAGQRPLSGFHSPAVRRLAAEHGIDLSRLRGTGRGGRITSADVLAGTTSEDSG